MMIYRAAAACGLVLEMAQLGVVFGVAFVLAEGQETIARAWVTRFPRWVSILFAAYLLFWTFLVGASLSSAWV